MGTTGKTWLTSPYRGKTRLSRRIGSGLLALGGFQGLRGASIRGIFPRNIEGRSALKSFPESNSACLSFLGRSALKSFSYLCVFLYLCDAWAESFPESNSSCLSLMSGPRRDLSRYVCLFLCVLFMIYTFGFKCVRCGDVLLCFLVCLCVLLFICKLFFDFVFYLEGPGFFGCSRFCPPLSG